MKVAAAFLLMAALPAGARERFEPPADPETAPYRIEGKGFVTDGGHPMHPGDFRRYDVKVQLYVDPGLGEAKIEVESGEGESHSIDRYFVRRGRIFQVNDKGEETLAEPLGDLSPATVAALHPAIVANLMRERPENLRPVKDGLLLAWNDELFTVGIDPKTRRILRLERLTYSQVLGDGTETVSYESWPEGSTLAPRRVVVSSRGRELARLDLAPITRGGSLEMPAGRESATGAGVVSAREIALRELAPHLFVIDLASMDTRVTVVEFEDQVAVIEGAYNSRICDLIVRTIRRERLGKPIRYFAFSHLHGQYVGGTRSYVHEGATVLVPPSTAVLIEQIAGSPSDLRPDALTREPKSLRLETVTEHKRIEDAVNALDIWNVASGHTDEYFLFYLPRQKVLLTGDLLFYTPGKPLTGRSKQLCETLRKLDVAPDTLVATWPLDGYGTKNIVSGAEMQAACAAAAEGEAPK